VNGKEQLPRPIMKPSRVFHFHLAGLVLSSTLHLACQAASFELLLTGSPPGPQNQDPATWQGVLQYAVTNLGAAPLPEPGIDRTNVSDPAGLAFRPSTHEVFVGNRHGNVAPSSISRFLYDFEQRTLRPNGTITGNGLYGVHQLTFHPVSGELFAANFSGGVSRFTFGPNDEALPNGVIGDGTCRGVLVSPTGRHLYVTTAGDIIRRFDLASGQELPPIQTPGSAGGGLHYLRAHQGLLYVAALYDDRVYRYRILPDDSLDLIDYLEMNDPVTVAFSPDGAEMFVSGHRTSSLIYRFLYSSATGGWQEEAPVDAGQSLGDALPIADAPFVAASVSGNGLTLSWPRAASNWVVEKATSLGESPQWTVLPLQVEVHQETVSAVVPTEGAAGFIRLRRGGTKSGTAEP